MIDGNEIDELFAPEIRVDNYGHTYIDGDGLERAKAKLNAMLVRARKEEVKKMQTHNYHRWSHMGNEAWLKGAQARKLDMDKYLVDRLAQLTKGEKTDG